MRDRLGAVLVNECYQLLCPTCVTPSVTKFILPSKINQLSRNSINRRSLSRNSRGRAEHLSRNSRRVEHLSRNSRGAEHLSRNSRGAEHLSRTSRRVEDLSRNSRGGQRSQVSVQGLRPHGYTPFACARVRERREIRLRPQSIIPERPSIVVA